MLNLYPKYEAQLKSLLTKNQGSSVLDVWSVFKELYLSFCLSKPQIVPNLGIMAEFYKGIDNTPSVFYFSLHYLIDDGVYNFSEWIYCEFDVPDDIAQSLVSESLELWDWDHVAEDIPLLIEKWDVFKSLVDENLKLRVYGTES